jgi:hypothetical protein
VRDIGLGWEKNSFFEGSGWDSCDLASIVFVDIRKTVLLGWMDECFIY